jgi:hypothetical protein
MDSIIYLLYVMGGFICNISLLYMNPLFIVCEIYIQWNPDLRFSRIFLGVPGKASYTQCINYPILVFLDLLFYPHLVDEN